ncbi:MAG: protein TolQ, partial [Xanthomonadaceae bacterium]|nr:protein TolQ [Xanthomonadaceae bacterium]
MTTNLNPLELVLQASLIVQIVMALLLLASIVSWAIMLRKRSELRRAQSDADRFEEVFWSGGDLSAMFRSIDQSRRLTKGMEAIFEQGFREFTRMRQHGVSAAELIEGARRGMRVALLRESDRLEHSLSMLATIGSTSPYVGLFGTVWGIMNAFHGLGNVQQATLAMVAPGIAEALIATAMGLFAAIPAVIAYNRYADQVSRI